MSKGPDAFRTISEVAEEIDLPQHVLRFWETRFTQIRPMKRGGGRRYYRPDDVDLLRGIRKLLYGEGYTIKGVQRILKEQGARHVAALADGHHLDALPEGELDDVLIDDGDVGVDSDADDVLVDGADDDDGNDYREPSRPERREPLFDTSRDYPDTAPLVRASRRGDALPPSRIPQAPPEYQASADDFLPPLVADAPVPPERDGNRVRADDPRRPSPVEHRREPTMATSDGGDKPPRPRGSGLPPDAADRLQAALIELLECKRILDQAR